MESDKLESIPAKDPKNFHHTVEWYGVVQTISDDYDCATILLTAYKQSSDKSIQGSADALLLAVSTTKDINEKLVGMQEALTKTTKPEDIDLNALAKMLATIKSAQGDVRNMIIFGVKMSTFSIERMEGTGDDEKPVLPIVLLITPAEQKSLLADVRDLAKKKGQTTDINLCGEILLNTLTSQRPPTSAGK